MAAVPFHSDEPYAGFAHCHGVIRNEAEGLCLEYQTKDSLVGLLKTQVREAHIPWQHIAAIELRRRWFGFSNRLVIQLASMKEVQDVPGVDQARLVLPVARRDCAMAQQLVEAVERCLRKG